MTARPASERIRVTYALALLDGEDPREMARDIAREQTVELPEGCYPQPIAAQVVGRIEELEPLPDGRWRAVISHDPAIVGDGIPALLNLLFGNISMKPGIQVLDLELPGAVLERFRGPAFGIAGVRELCGVGRRPLVCAAAKPVGLSARELAAVAARFAEGGVDIVKDDHSLADQAAAPFAERVARCAEAVAAVNVRTGGATRYFPNLLAPVDQLDERLELVRRAGCSGVVVSPWLLGLDAVRRLAQGSGVVLFAHPALSGAFFHERHGIAPDVLYGLLFRLIGSDGVIYPSAGGRFPFSELTCRAINERLRGPLGALRPAFPVAGGGVDADRVPYWIEQYGLDTIFLIGSSFYQQADLAAASRRVVEAVRAYDEP